MFDYPSVSRFFMPMLQDLVLVTEGAESKPVWDLSGIISVSITIITMITIIIISLLLLLLLLLSLLLLSSSITMSIFR
jgi:hypothetical protein